MRIPGISMEVSIETYEEPGIINPWSWCITLSGGQVIEDSHYATEERAKISAILWANRILKGPLHFEEYKCQH